MSASRFFLYILQEKDFPEVSCQKDLSIQDTPYKMSCTVTMFKSPFNAMWHDFKGHAYNILSYRKWPVWSQEKTDERQAERYEADKWSQRQDIWCIFTPTRIFKVMKMKKQNHNPEVPLSPLLTNATSPPHLFVFFSLSLSLSSPWVVSLIGQQTACKCSNPEKSPGALVIGCALQHSSQSIKARWAPVNSFSLLLLWLWYCHIDSNFALNPSTTVLSLSLCLFHSFSLHFSFHFQSPRIPHSKGIS